jgi:hypothetical protein
MQTTLLTLLKVWNIMALSAEAGATASPLCEITYAGMRIVGGVADDENGKLELTRSRG